MDYEESAMGKDIVIKTKYTIGDTVRPVLGDDKMKVVAFEIDANKRITYGCATKNGERKWFADFEIKKYNKSKSKRIKGFVLKLNSQKK